MMCDFTASPARETRGRVEIDAPPDQVFASLIEPAELTIVHSGFGDDRRPDGYQLGWQEFLVSLTRMLEVGAGGQPVRQAAPAACEAFAGAPRESLSPREPGLFRSTASSSIVD
jgi:hypothetical protein